MLQTNKLGVVEFGKQLITTLDLDPVYYMLHQSGMKQGKLERWLLAYLCYYHCGTASWIVDQPNYWSGMQMAAGSKEWPRGSERRHFRGEFSVRAVAKLASMGVTAVFEMLTKSQPVTLEEMMKRVKSLYGFGDWVAFKTADILERLQLCQVEFTDADTFLFDSPRKGAELVFETYGGETQVAADVVDIPQWAFAYLQESELGCMLAPPAQDRVLNGQEYETVLCKWHGHCKGGYYVGHDITEIRHGLLKFAKSKTAQQLLQCLPKEVTKVE